MKVTQIATIMNTVFPEVQGKMVEDENGNLKPEKVVLTDDCTNIADFGTAVDSTYALGDNFNTYFKKIADKVAEQILISDEYDKDEEFSIRKIGIEAGSILEMDFFEDGDFVSNTSWDEIVSGSETAKPTFDDMFGYHPVQASAEYFNKKVTTASEVYTITYLQWKSATISVEKLTAFFAQIEMRWTNKMKQLDKKLRQMLVASWIAEKRRQGWNGCFNVLAEYKKKFPTATTTAATAATDGDFLRFQKAFIEIMRETLRERTKLYNPKGYVGAVPKSRQKMLLYAPMAEYMAVWLYSDKYHDDYVKLGGYDTVSCWQAIGDGTDDATKMTVKVKTQNSNNTAVLVEGVVGVIFDDRAIFTVDDNPRTVAQRNDFSEWTNYQHKKDISLYATTALNGVVFYISDYVYASDISGLENAPSNWAAIITAGVYTESNGTYTAVTSGTSYDKTKEYYYAV